MDADTHGYTEFLDVRVADLQRSAGTHSTVAQMADAEGREWKVDSGKWKDLARSWTGVCGVF